MAEAGLIVIHEKSPYELLDYETECFLTNTRGLWQSLRADTRIVAIIQNYYYQSQNPHETALKLMYNAGDFNSSKPLSLSVFFITVFAEWLAANKDRVHAVEPQVKIDALKLVLEQKNASFISLVIKTFDMVSEREIFVPVVEQLLAHKKYKDACQTAGALGLHSNFNLEAFLIPLYIQDKLVVIEDYLSGDKQSLMDFVKYLDDLLEGDTRTKLADVVKRLDMREIKLTKCEYKPLSKFLLRLLKKFNLPNEVCPVLIKRRRKGALHFLIARRFGAEGEGNSEGWAEMVLDAVGDSKELQEELIQGVLKAGLPDEAQEWTDRFACKTVSAEQKKPPVDATVLSCNSGIKTPPTSPVLCDKSLSPVANDVTIPYLRLPFPEEDIVVVDSAELLARFATALDNVDVVGIDCEWKPSFGLSENGLSLIQIALRDEVYILDVAALSGSGAEFSAVMLEKLFNNKKIMKIGFNLVGDVKVLQKAISGLKDIDCLLDLASLWLVLRDRHKLVFPFASDPSKAPSSGKLKDLVSLCLGKTLDKTEQFSNWDLRPLRPSQLYYAALDAYCLLDIYDTFKECCEKQKICVQDVVQGLVMGRSPHVRWEPAFPTTLSVTDVDIVCTWELWMLAKRLRQCGVNTVYMSDRYPTRGIKKLLYGRGYHLLVTQTPTWQSNELKILKVPAKEVKIQLQYVLQHLHLEVLPQDCGTRCLECNSSSTEERTREEIKIILNFDKAAQNKVLSYKPAGEEDDGYDDWEDYEEVYEEPPAAVESKVTETLPRDYTLRGKKIQAEKLPSEAIGKYDVFLVCQECGVVRWVEPFTSIFQ